MGRNVTLAPKVLNGFLALWSVHGRQLIELLVVWFEF